MLHDDPWQADDSPGGNPLRYAPAGVSRSFSEGHAVDADGKGWLRPLADLDTANASASLDPTGLYHHPPATASNVALDLTKSMRDSVDLTIPREADAKGKGKGKEVGQDSASLVERVMVWSSMVETSNGRDKILVR